MKIYLIATLTAAVVMTVVYFVFGDKPTTRRGKDMVYIGAALAGVLAGFISLAVTQKVNARREANTPTSWAR